MTPDLTLIQCIDREQTELERLAERLRRVAIANKAWVAAVAREDERVQARG